MKVVLGCMGRWIIVHDTKDTLAWTGSRWTKHWDGIPIGDAQICNFDTKEEAEQHLAERPTVH